MKPQSNTPQPSISTPILDDKVVFSERYLINGQKAVLSWNGERLKLVLGASLENAQAVLFDVLPQEVTKIHIYQRIAMRFYIKGKKYLVYYPELSKKQLDASITGGIAPHSGGGAALEEMRDVALQSPANTWHALYQQLGIKVQDNTFVPPTRASLVGWTVLIVVVIFVLVVAVGFGAFLLSGR